MKKILLSISCLVACVLSVHAQTLFGPTFKGGINGAGTVNKFMPATNDLSLIKSFEGFESDPYFTNFIQASDGKLYGMTTYGGASDSGAIFSFDPLSSAYTKLKDLNYTTGTEPYGSLMQANDGILYGTTNSGGTGGQGVIFSFDPSTTAYSILKEFSFNDGTLTYSNLLQASDGKLYGTTASGGTNFAGVMFSFDISTATYTKLRDFDMTTGAYPYGSLLQATDGKLYGIAAQGGSNSYGVIYSFDPSTSVFTDEKDFDLATTGGYSTNGNLIQASNGKLYGMTYRGGASDAGVIFSFDPSSTTYTNLKEFDINDGAYPYSGLSQASNGKLYGMTYGGGSDGSGVIFSFDLSTSNYIKLKDFDNASGTSPFGNLFLANDGKFYGLTHSGGTGNHGVIFSLDPSNSTYTKLKDFGTNLTGSNVSGALLKAADGKLYGMTTFGGSNAAGGIFSIDPATSAFTNLKDFDKTNGASPYGSLIQASNGKIYGTTTYGGSNDNGIIFSLDPSTSTFTNLRDFDYTTGGNPYGSLVQAGDGKLYGTTANGGGSSAGVLFSFDPVSSAYTVLKELDYGVGGSSYSGLTQAGDGKLYGTTIYDGGNAAGSIFSFDPVSSTFTNFQVFTNLNGSGPMGKLIQGTDGKLYGMTSLGGLNNFGVIYSFDPSSNIYTDLQDFDNNNGSTSYGSLMQASDGKLYGMTYQGGSSGGGTIFSFDPAGNSFIKLKDFIGSNGANPLYGAAFVEVNNCVSKTYYRDADSDSFGDPNVSVTACGQPAGYVSNKLDCNDNNKAIHGPVTWYRDADSDGFGNPAITVQACTRPAGYVKNNFDCNDNKRAARPWNEKVIMCHNGAQECVRLIDVIKKLRYGWSLGPCPAFCNSSLAKTITGVIENEELNRKLESIPLQYKLSNYPNPFAGSSMIKYELPQDSKVSIKVYDATGRLIATLVDAYKKAGSYTVQFNAGRLSSGSLYYRIIAKSKEQKFEQTNQMLKIK